MHLDPVTIAPVSNAGLSNHFHGKEVLKLKWRYWKTLLWLAITELR
jgi:hypothetical protein